MAAKFNVSTLLIAGAVILIPFLFLGVNTYSTIVGIFSANPVALFALVIIIIMFIGIIRKIRR